MQILDMIGKWILHSQIFSLNIKIQSNTLVAN